MPRLAAEAGQESNEIVLHLKEHPLHILSEGTDYPWRCGLYRFEVRYGGECCYGMFEVHSRHLDSRQLRQLQDTLREQLDGLVEESLIGSRNR